MTLSLDKPHIIHQQHDAFGALKVMDTSKMRSLFFETSVEQSRLYFEAPMCLPFEYQQVIETQLLKHHQTHPVQRILMLGMGGGSIAKQLNMLLPNTSIHIVELRQAVIDIAYEYFQLPDVPEIEAIQEDALVFIKEALSTYDVIIMDIFNDNGLPKAFSTPEFQTNLLNNLSPKGLILFNLWENQAPSEQTQTQRVLHYWQSHAVSQSNIVKNYPIPSTENIILHIQKN